MNDDRLAEIKRDAKERQDHIGDWADFTSDDAAEKWVELVRVSGNAVLELAEEVERLRERVKALEEVLQSVRGQLHAANRPMLREGLRIELRDEIDAALQERST